MNSVRRQPQYLDRLLRVHLLANLNDLPLASVLEARRLWWLVVSIVLLLALFFSLPLADVIQ